MDAFLTPARDGQPARCIGLRRKTLHEQERILLEPLARFDADIRSVVSYDGRRAVLTERSVYIDTQQFASKHAVSGLLFSEKQKNPLAVAIRQGKLYVHKLNTGEAATMPDSLPADRFQIIDHRLYLETGNRLIEAQCRELGTKLFISAGASWPIQPNAEINLTGMFYREMLGVPHLLLPFRAGCWQNIAVPELRDRKIIGGHYDNGVAQIVAVEDEKHDEKLTGITLRFNADHSRYAAHIEANRQNPDIDFVSLENGIVMSNNTDIQLFFSNPERTERKIIAKSAAADNRLRLAKDGTQVLAFSGDTLYKIMMTSTVRDEQRAGLFRKLRSECI